MAWKSVPTLWLQIGTSSLYNQTLVATQMMPFASSPPPIQSHTPNPRSVELWTIIDNVVICTICLLFILYLCFACTGVCYVLELQRCSPAAQVSYIDSAKERICPAGGKCKTVDPESVPSQQMSHPDAITHHADYSSNAPRLLTVSARITLPAPGPLRSDSSVQEDARSEDSGHTQSTTPNGSSRKTSEVISTSRKDTDSVKRPQRDVITLIKDAFVVHELQFPSNPAGLPNPVLIYKCDFVQEMQSRNLTNEMCSVLGGHGRRPGHEVNKALAGFIGCSCHWNELQLAIATEDINWVRFVLFQGHCDVNAPGPRGAPLFIAAEYGLIDILELLITFGARVTNEIPRRHSLGYSQFQRACMGGHHKVAEVLLRHKIYVHQTPGCLREACYYGHVELVAVLLGWRRKGCAYHRKALPLKGCIDLAQERNNRGMGFIEGDVCQFLGQWRPGESQDLHGYEGGYTRAVAIIELLIEAGAKHSEECRCWRKDWSGRRQLVVWNRDREQSQSQIEDPNPDLEDDTQDEGTDSDDGVELGTDEAKALLEIKNAFKNDGQYFEPGRRIAQTAQRHPRIRSAKSSDLCLTLDGLYRDPRGWWWESPNQYLTSEPTHPTWRPKGKGMRGATNGYSSPRSESSESE